MNWTEVIENPVLHDLPFKIELNEFGQIVMTPISNKRGILMTQIGTVFNGENDSDLTILNCSIQTSEGVKVADAAYCSDKFLAKHGCETQYQEAPEVCVEIVSRSNSRREMKEKLYFERGAKEVWLCYENGKVEFFNLKKQIEQSPLFPNFPT